MIHFCNILSQTLCFSLQLCGLHTDIWATGVGWVLIQPSSEERFSLTTIDAGLSLSLPYHNQRKKKWKRPDRTVSVRHPPPPSPRLLSLTLPNQKEVDTPIILLPNFLQHHWKGREWERVSDGRDIRTHRQRYLVNPPTKAGRRDTFRIPYVIFVLWALDQHWYYMIPVIVCASARLYVQIAFDE